MTQNPQMCDVTLVPLDVDTLDHLTKNDLTGAGQAMGLEIPAAFEDDRWLWQIRHDDLVADPASVEWLVRAIVRDGDEIVGHAGFHGPPDEAGSVAVAYSILPSHRGHGLAKAALRELLALALAGGASSVLATISPDNAASLGVIAEFGFELKGEQWDEEDGLELVYARSLSPNTDEG